jgi:hypothetical protein
MAAVQATPCQWNNAIGCQFPVDDAGDLIHWQGRNYCHFHLPLEAGALKPGITDAEEQLLRNQASLRGVQLPARQYTFHATHGVRDVRDCVFASGCHLSLGRAVFDFRGSRFGSTGDSGRVTIAFSDNSTAQLDETRAFASLEIQAGNKHRAVDWSLRGAVALGEVDLRNINFVDSFDISGATFHARVRFDGTELPQQSRAQGVKFIREALAA